MQLLILRDDPWLLAELPAALAAGAAPVEPRFAPEIPPLPSAFRPKWKLAAIALRHLARMTCSGFHRRVRSADTVLACGITVALPYLLLARLGRRFRPRGRIVVFFFFLHRLGRLRWLQRTLHWLLDRDPVVLVLHSTADRDYFAGVVGLRRARLEVLPYGQEEAVLAPLPGDAPPQYVFAGGYSNRDYELFFRALAATGLPAVVACPALTRLPAPPANVRVLRDLEPREFNAWLAGAVLAVIPLRDRVGSSGQAVAVTAMSLGLAVVYSDTPCLQEYFLPGVTGEPFAHGDASALAERLGALWQDPARRQALGGAARADYVARFSRRAQFERLVELLGEGRLSP